MNLSTNPYLMMFDTIQKLIQTVCQAEVFQWLSYSEKCKTSHKQTSSIWLNKKYADLSGDSFSQIPCSS